ncbi:hypothetical protein Tco_0197139 [Tanacetum coccineum]
MAPMALSDSKVNNDKSCSKTCLTNYEALKKQYDDLLVKLDDTGFIASTSKRGHKEYLMGLLRTELEKVKEVEEMFERIISKGRRLKDLIQKKLDDLKDNHKFRGGLLGINLHKTYYCQSITNSTNGVSTASTYLVLSELVNTTRRKINTADGQSC